MAGSYQDVDWSHSGGGDKAKAAPTTEAPVTLKELSAMFGSIGYQMLPKDPYSPFDIVQWARPSAPPITMAAPQFRADGYQELVYDRSDLVDFFMHFHGNDVDGVELLAKLTTKD